MVCGCQAESLQLIREKYSNVRLPEYTIGLICGGQHSGYMIDDLIEQSGCDDENISRFRFRDKAVGWPGDVHISTRTKDYWLPNERRLRLKQIYELHRCIVCYGQMDIFCDIVCGAHEVFLKNNNPKGILLSLPEQSQEKSSWKMLQ